MFANSTQANTGYLNDNGVLRSTPDLGWLFPTGTHTQSIALGDIDGDGDLDLVCGNSGQASRLYLNDGGALQTSPAWTSSQANQTTSVVLGDVEGDGDLDIICGNSADSTSLYLNVGGTVQSAPVLVFRNDRSDDGCGAGRHRRRQRPRSHLWEPVRKRQSVH